MTADLVTVAAFVAVTAAAWYVLGRIEAHLLRTGARHPAQDETRLLPIYYLNPTPMPDDVFVAEVDRLGLREPLLDMAREHDAGLRVPDAFVELPRRGGAR